MGYYAVPTAVLIITSDGVWRPELTWVILVALITSVLMLARNTSWLTAAILAAITLRPLAASATPTMIVLLAYEARRRPLWQALALGLAGVGAAFAEAAVWQWSQPIWVQALILTVGETVAIAVGFGFRQYRQTQGAVRAQQTAEQARVLAAREADAARLDQVRIAERERIAREMHDVLAHRLSLVAMASGALAYRDDLSPDELREAASMINENAKRCLDELRLVLGTLRTPPAAPEPPQPTISQLPALVAEATAAGQQVHLDLQLDDPAAVPSQLGRHGYRIVQEALTNARKHAPGVPVEVSVSGAAGAGMHVSVRNQTLNAAVSVPGAGLGLVGLAERVQLLGGDFSSGHQGDEFVVEAQLPWQ